MKKTNVRFIAFILTLLMALSVISGCANDNKPEESTVAVATSQAPSDSSDGPEETTGLVANLPDKKWDREFRILGTNASNADSFPNFEIEAEAMTGAALNDAIFSRNQAVYEKYGITIKQYLFSSPENELQKLCAAPEDEYDLVFMNVDKVGARALAGNLIDMNTIDNIDFSKPWWREEVNECVSICGKIFYTGSNFSLRDKNRISVMMINDELRKDLKLESVPELVRNNQWTAETLLRFVNTASSDLNGDGNRTRDDQFGLVTHSYKGFSSLCFGFGLRLLDKDKDDKLVTALNSDRDNEVFDKILQICTKETFMTPEDYDKDWAVSADTLKDGRALIASTLLASIGSFNSSCDFDFTVIPNAKLNEDQEKYYTIPDVYCMLFGVPATVQDTDFVGFALEAFSYEATDTSYVTYIETMCKARNVRNADSVEMLNIILDGVIYDNGIFFASSVPLFGIITGTIAPKKINSYLNDVQSNAKATQSSINNINKKFAD